jgi:hypothetical protein
MHQRHDKGAESGSIPRTGKHVSVENILFSDLFEIWLSAKLLSMFDGQPAKKYHVILFYVLRVNLVRFFHFFKDSCTRWGKTKLT